MPSYPLEKCIKLSPFIVSSLGHFTIESLHERYEDLDGVIRLDKLNGTILGHDIGYVTFSYFKGGNGSVGIKETFYQVGYEYEKPFRLVEFEYSLVIDKQYELKFHFHPDSGNLKHAFVHIHTSVQTAKPKDIYFNPFKDLDLKKLALTKEYEEVLEYVWNSSYSWPNTLVNIFKSHSEDEKVTRDMAVDALDKIFSSQSEIHEVSNVLKFPSKKS
ncbi:MULTISPECIES: hypothetical protein [unclassified Halobacteriovorax]|uniref:hypothetical protein n=1 Tax=unclassified Halobacteriovorax TaxID=2639665 RepID=UPI00399BD3A7